MSKQSGKDFCVYTDYYPNPNDPTTYIGKWQDTCYSNGHKSSVNDFIKLCSSNQLTPYGVDQFDIDNESYVPRCPLRKNKTGELGMVCTNEKTTGTYPVDFSYCNH